MNLLLDTHALIWFLEGSSEISENAKFSIENPSNNKFVSIASIWEIAIKLTLGKLYLGVPFEKFLSIISENGFSILGVDSKHIIQLTKLELLHRDPFDRLIIAQAVAEDFHTLTRDSSFHLYSKVKILW